MNMLADFSPSFQAADDMDKALLLWRVNMNTLEKDLRAKEKIEARAYDLYRNNDLMRALVEKQVDALVGSHVTLLSQPDYKALGVSQSEAAEWAATVENEYHTYAHSPDNWISADRSMDLTQLLRSAARSLIMTGEIFSSREWLKSPVTYNTAFQLVSSHRIKSPNNYRDGKVFYGIEFNDFGEAEAYHIESFKMGQKRNFGQKEIKRYGKRNAFNWLQIYHIYEPIVPEYPRGISRLACVIKPILQRGRYIEADLDKNIIAANYVMAITSNESPESVADMLSGADQHGSNGFEVAAGGGLPPEVAQKREEILNQITQRVIELTGGHLLHLFDGEKAEILQAPNAGQTSGDYAASIARHVANGAGMSYAYATGDFKGLSFSAGQMDLGIFEHGANITRQLYIYKLAKLWFRTWLDEAMLKGTVPLLGGKEYWPNREAYSRCDHSGAKRVHIDPVKRANSNKIDLANVTTSRTSIANELGVDLDAIITERANEAAKIVAAIVSAAEKQGLTVSDEAKLKIIIDVVGTSSVETPDTVVEIEESGDGNA